MADAPRKAAWPPPRPGGPVARATGRPPPPPPILERKWMGYLDKDLRLAWEANLTGPELDDWKRLRDILDRSSADFRACVINYVFDQELQAGRTYYAQAVADNEPFRADCIKGNAGALKGQIARLDTAVTDYLVKLDAHTELGRQLNQAQQTARSVVTVVQLAVLGFRKVAAPWSDCWPGAARGRGISKYDGPAGVAAVKAEVDRARAQRLGEQMRRRANREPDPEQEQQRAPLARPGTPSLFGGGGGGR